MWDFADPWDRQRFVLSSKSFFFVRPPLPLPRCRQHFQRFHSEEFSSLHLFCLKVIAWKIVRRPNLRGNWLSHFIIVPSGAPAVQNVAPSNWNSTIIPFIFNLRASPSLIRACTAATGAYHNVYNDHNHKPPPILSLCRWWFSLYRVHHIYKTYGHELSLKSLRFHSQTPPLLRYRFHAQIPPWSHESIPIQEATPLSAHPFTIAQTALLTL